MFNDPAIAGSWPALIDRLDRAGRPTAWARQAPALAGLVSVADLPGMVAEHVPPAHADEVIGALVRLAAADGADDPDALLVLLHLLSGGVHALEKKLAHLSDNILPLVVGELTCRIRRYPWQRRTRAHAKNLLLDTKQALLRGELRGGLPGQPAVVPVDPHDPAFLRLDVAHTENDDVDVVDMLHWAGGHGVAPLQDLRMLLDLERRRGYGNATRHQVARDLGINERTVRRRRDCALTALRKASSAYLAEVACAKRCIDPKTSAQKVAVRPATITRCATAAVTKRGSRRASFQVGRASQLSRTGS